MTGQISINMSTEDIKAIASEVVNQLRTVSATKIVGTKPTDTTNNKILLTDNDVADMLGISKCTVWNYTKSGLIPKPYKFGCNTRWKLQEILLMVDMMQLNQP